MPQPVCTFCAKKMKVNRIGIIVEFDLKSGAPYQQWSADEAQCPTCFFRIVTRYGGGLTWQQHQGIGSPNFTKIPDVIVLES